MRGAESTRYAHYVREGVRLEADLFRLKQPFYLFCEVTSNKSGKNTTHSASPTEKLLTLSLHHSFNKD